MAKLLRLSVAALTGICIFGLIGCSSTQPPLPTVDSLSLDRFMGDWYVIGLIPNRVEKHAHDSVESYALRPDGKIAITYTFKDGGFDAPEKTLNMVARVKDEETNAEWRVRPFWPLSLKYLVTDLAEDYRYVVIAHPSRNYLWIMARESRLSDGDWRGIVDRLVALDFDESRIVRVPHSPTG